MDSFLLVFISANLFIIFARIKSDSCPDLPNHIPDLPGLHDKDTICNYAGYSGGSPYFYWFMVKSNYTRLLNVPLLVYIGSGMQSSLVRMFQPGGPYRLDQIGPEYKISIVESLLDEANILYVEQPGMFTFSKERFTGEYNVYVFLNELQRFLDSFVQYNGLIGMGRIYIVAEGFMVKIAAMMANPSARQNSKYTIRGLILNNGIYDLSMQASSLTNLGAELGAIPENLLSQMTEETYITQGMLDLNPGEAYTRAKFLINSFKNISGLPNFIDDVSDTTGTDHFSIIEGYLSEENVQKALHIKQKVPWDRLAKSSVFERAIRAVLNVSTPEFNDLIMQKSNIDIMFNVGVYSPLSSIDGFQRWVKSSQWGGKEKIFLSNRIFVSDNNSIIYVKEKDQIIYAIYPDEGSILGSYSLKHYLSAVSQFVKVRTIYGLIEDDTELVQILNQCNNNGFYNTTSEECECNANFYGADCSISLSNLEFNKKYILGQGSWVYFIAFLENPLTKFTIVLRSEDYKCKSNSEILLTVSGSLDELPDENDNDLLARSHEIYIDREISNESGKIILGIKNVKPYCGYEIMIMKDAVESSTTDFVEKTVIGLIITMACLMIGTCIGCYLVSKPDIEKLNEIKV